MNEKNIKSQGQNPKISKLAILSLLLGPTCFYIFLAIKLGLMSSYMPAPLSLGDILFLIAIFLSAPIGLTIGIVALMRIQKSKGLLKGKGIAIAGVIISAAMTLFLSYRQMLSMRPSQHKKRIAMVCGTNLSGLGKALHIYAGDYDDQYPTAEKWCDLLIAYIEVSPKQFVCPLSDVIEGESSYAMNKNVVGKKVSEIPEDVVLLFETNLGKNPAGRQELLGNREWYKELSSRGDRWDLKWIKKYRSSEKVYKQRWNQVGGPEILTTENHKGKGCNILFNDGSVEFVKTERLGELVWEVEEEEK